MLLVSTEVRPSPIHGQGCFTAQAIAKGEKIADMTDVLVWQIEDLKLLSTWGRQQVLLHSWREGDKLFSPTDNGKFINFSQTPNVGTAADDCDYALRDIAAGEELTIGYLTITPAGNLFNGKVEHAN